MPEKFGKCQKFPEFVRNFILHFIFSIHSLAENVPVTLAAAASSTQNTAGIASLSKLEEVKGEQLELLAMGAADAEAEAYREWARQDADAADEAEEEERVLSAEAPSRDAEAAPLYGMEAIMAGTAYAEGWEDAEASLVVGIGN